MGFKKFIKNVSLFLLPKLLGGIAYYILAFIFLILATVLVGMSLIEITYSNVDYFVYYLLGAGLTLTLMVFTIILFEKVQFKWKIRELDASIGKFHRSSEKVGGMGESTKTSISKAILVGVLLIITVVIILCIFGYLFAVIFVDGDIQQTVEYFFNT